jgi:hypothetical protein
MHAAARQISDFRLGRLRNRFAGADPTPEIISAALLPGNVWATGSRQSMAVRSTLTCQPSAAPYARVAELSAI